MWEWWGLIMGAISLEQRKSSVKASCRWIKTKLEDSCRICVVIKKCGRKIHQVGVPLVKFGQQGQYYDHYSELMDPA